MEVWQSNLLLGYVGVGVLNGYGIIVIVSFDDAPWHSRKSFMPQLYSCTRWCIWAGRKLEPPSPSPDFKLQLVSGGSFLHEQTNSYMPFRSCEKQKKTSQYRDRVETLQGISTSTHCPAETPAMGWRMEKKGW
jgi:hypothetical protein